MFNKSLVMAIALSVLPCGPLILGGPEHATAATSFLMNPPWAVGTQHAAKLEPVANMKRKWYYDRHRHGHRYKHRQGYYRFHHDGWWYSRPWWTFGPGITLDIGPSVGYGGYNAHIRWCLDHYRSYNPRTDSYFGYDGDRHRCHSPYD